MQITEGSYSYASSYASLSYTEVSERLEIGAPGARPPGDDGEEPLVREFGGRPGGPRGLAGLTGADGPARPPERSCDCDREHIGSDEMKDRVGAKFAALIDLIERMTGERFDILDEDDLGLDGDGGGAHDHGAGPGAGPGGLGQTITYDRIERRVEAQSLRVAASATVTTGDGRELSVDLQLQMDRLFVEESRTHVRIGPPPELKDPLVVDLGGAPEAIDGSVRAAFDLDADGNLDEVPWVRGNSAFLALDRNGNGVIDDGSELFGATTGDGFAELARLDTDGDGFIDEDDDAFDQLRLVRGSTDVADTQGLLEANVGAIAVRSVAAPLTERDADGEVVAAQREAGFYLREDGSGAGSVRQVDMAI